MKGSYQELLQPDIVNSIAGLTLLSRIIVDGYLSGHNQSRRVGAGLEFSQYRGYEAGDDLRLLDWKMLARSGRYYIKQSEIDTHIAVKFILDNSKSMLHQEGGLTKMDYAKVVIAALGTLAQNQGDMVGLYAVNDTDIHHLIPAVNKQHLNRLLHELVSLNPQGAWPTVLTTEQIHDRSQKELLFFITDLYENQSELTSIVKELKTVRNEVVVLHLMGKGELEFDYQGPFIFEDLETGARIKVDAKNAKTAYLDALAENMNRIKNELLAEGIGYTQFRLDQHIGEVLQLFLKKRTRLL